MNIVFLLLGAVLSLIGAAFCAGVETGFLSIPRGRILYLARAGSSRANVIKHALDNMACTTTVLLVGNNLASVAYSSATSALAVVLFSDSFSRSMCGLIAAFVVLYCSEFMPKLLMSTRPLHRLLPLVPVYRVLDCILHPLACVAMAFTNLVFPIKPRAREKLTADDVLRILKDRKDGVRLTDFESALIAHILVARTNRRPVIPAELLSILKQS